MKKSPEQRQAEKSAQVALMVEGLHCQATIYAAIDALLDALTKMDASPATKRTILQNSLNYLQSKMEELQ